MIFAQKENCVKAILVLNDIHDIPKNCMSCPLIEYHHEYSIICRHYQTGDTRPTWCPLRPLPDKIEVKVEKIEDIMHTELQLTDIFSNKIMAEIKFETDKLIALGYNACIDKIVGEQNDMGRSD